jgi:UPF0716 protein FxsA
MPIVIFIAACAEIILLIKLGQVIGAAPVVGIVLLSAVLGITFLRMGGKAALSRLARNALMGQLSTKDFLRRELSVLLAGILFLVPGLLSDGVGLILLARYALSRPKRSSPEPPPEDVIDIEYEVHED